MKNYSLNIFAKFYLAWLIFIFFFTETISYLNLISRGVIIFGNLFFLLGFVYQYRDDIKRINFYFIRSKLYLIILSIAVFIFIQGFFSAPNTTDAMTYHITRVMYWIQEKTVQQDYIRGGHDFQPPFAEYIYLNLYLLLNNDRLLFLSNWLAFVMSIYLGGVVAFRLGANEKTVSLIRLFIASIPIAVLQASSTQVDLITNVLAIFGLYFVLNLIKKPVFKDCLILGVITGLGLQVKSPFMFNILIPLGLLGIMRAIKIKKEIYLFLIILLVVLLMQVRYWNQNIHLYGSPLGQHLAGEKNFYVNDRFDGAALFSNVIRNLFNQFPVPIAGSIVESDLNGFLNLIGTDNQDPATTYPGLVFHILPVVFPQEDIASSPIHLVLIILALILMYKNRKEIKNYKIVASVLVMVSVSFVLFSFILKYEPYHPRLQIPYFTIGSIFAVLVILSYKWGNKILIILLVPSLLLSFGLIFLNVLRPYISYNIFYEKVKAFATPNASIPEAFYAKPRNMQYFNPRPYWYEPYQEATDLIASTPGFKYIVLKIYDDDYEYPFWALFKQKNVSFYLQNGQSLPLEKKKVNLSKNAIILTTSQRPFKLDGYRTDCFKTKIDYGYACVSFEN